MYSALKETISKQLENLPVECSGNIPPSYSLHNTIDLCPPDRMENIGPYILAFLSRAF